MQPGQTIRASVTNPGRDTAAVLEGDASTVARLARLSALETVADAGEGTANAVPNDGTTVSVPLGDLVDVQKECARLAAEEDRLGTAIQGQEGKLGNEQFLSRAPAAVVQKEREKLTLWKEQAASLSEKRRRLGCPA